MEYDIDLEEQMLQEWQRFEEEKLNKPQAKVVDISIKYDKEVEAIIIDKAW